MASTSAICGNYNYATGVTTYAYGIYDSTAGRDIFVGRTIYPGVVQGFFAQHLPTLDQVKTAYIDGLTVGNLEYWCNMGH